MLPTSKSAEGFITLPAFHHSAPSVPEMQFPFLLSITFPRSCNADCAQCPLPPLTPGVFGYLFSTSSLNVSRDGPRQTALCKGKCLRCSPWTPASLSCVFLLLEPGLCQSLYILQHCWVDSLNPKRAFLPSVMGKHLSFPIVTTSFPR